MSVLGEFHDSLSVASAGTSVIVTLLASTLAILAFLAATKRRSPNLRWVGAAFVVFAAKNAFSAYNVWTHVIPHDAIELTLSLFDLVLLGLIFAPLLRRRTA